MMIHEVTEKVGKHKRRKRVGRGPGSGLGKTCGRGHKGAKSRAGASGSIRASSEGGQMPFFRRFPKRGFSNARFRKIYRIVNIKAIDARFDDGATVNPETLVEAGLIHDAKLPVKILGEGETTKKLDVTAAMFSKSASDKITKAGGKVTATQPVEAAPAPKAKKPAKTEAKADAKPEAKAEPAAETKAAPAEEPKQEESKDADADADAKE